MKKNKSIYLFLITYCAAYIFLALEVINTKIDVDALKLKFNGDFKFYLAFIIISILTSLIILLLEYVIIKYFVAKSDKFEDETKLAIPLVLTDSLLIVFALLSTFFTKNAINVLPFINIILGPIIFGFFLKDNLSDKQVKTAVIAKFILYLINIPFVLG